MFRSVLSCANFVKSWKQVHWVYTSMQIRSKIKASCLTFPKIPITWTHYTVPTPWPSVLPLLALHSTTPMGFTYNHLQPYITTTALMGFRYYHVPPYYYPHGLQVFPPSALQTTTPLGFRYYHLQPYNPSKLLFVPIFYIRALQYLFNCGTVYIYIYIFFFFFFCRVGLEYFICVRALSFKMEFPAFSCIVFLQWLVRLNNDFQFALCACVAAVDILFLCPCFSCSILRHSQSLITTLASSQRIFLDWNYYNVELWGFKNFSSWRKWLNCSETAMTPVPK